MPIYHGLDEGVLQIAIGHISGQLSDIKILEVNEVERSITSSDAWDLTLFTCTHSRKSLYAMRFKKL